MARKAKGKGKAKKAALDVYEHEDGFDDLKEQRENDRMDIDGVYEYEAPDKISRDDDSEIDEDEAFNSDDENTFGTFFSGKEKTQNDSDNDTAPEEDEDVDGGDLLSDMLGTKPAVRIDTVEDEEDEEEYSEEEEEDDDGDKHAALMNMVNKMAKGTKRKITHAETTEDVAPSAFSKKLGGSALTLEGLLGASMGSLPGDDDENVESGEALQSSSGISQLKKQFSKLENDESKLQARAAPVTEARATRKVAYAEKTKEMDIFQPVVKANRLKETLDFRNPGNKQVENLTVASLATKFVPEKPLESDVAAILQSSGWSDKTILQEEAAELAANEVTIEEVRERQGELSKMRAMMFYQEQKNKRIKKIKSKLYHKIRNKQEDRKDRMSLRELDPELADKMDAEDAEKRAEERMTLKHTNTSKWVKHQLRRGINADQGTRSAIADQLRRGDELRKKMHSINDDSDDDSDDDENNEKYNGLTETEKLQQRLQKKAAALVMDIEADGQPTDKKTEGLHGMKFMKQAAEKQRERALEEAEALLKELRGDSYVENDDEGASKKATSEPAKKKIKVTDADKITLAKNIVHGSQQTKSVMMDKAHKTRVASAIKVDFGNKEKKATVQVEKEVEETGAVAEVNPWLNKSASGKKRRNRAKKNGDKTSATATVASAVAAMTADKVVENTKPLTELNNTKKSDKRKSNESEESEKAELVQEPAAKKTKKSNALSTQEELVRKAFAFADEGENDIQKEKELLAAQDGDAKVGAEVAKLTGMEGWGNWAGEGIRPSKRQNARLVLAQRKAKEAKDAALVKRKDSKMEKVLINERKDKQAAKLMCATIPYPFTSREQYEMAMRNPLGSDWNTVHSSSALTVPEVMTRAGKIIEPLRLTNEQKKASVKELSKTAKQSKQRKAKF